MLFHIEFLEESLKELEAQMEGKCCPFAEAMERLDTMPGDKRSAQDLTAEIGVEMKQLPSHRHLCSWAKMCPGNEESGGERDLDEINKKHIVRHLVRRLESLGLKVALEELPVAASSP
jgi:hypothetical protein